jgi:hypothetical protein
MIKAVKHLHLTSEARHLTGETLALRFRRLSVTATFRGADLQTPGLETAGEIDA